MKYVLLTLIALAAVFVLVALRRALRAYLKFRGKMLVSCPETHGPAAVRVAGNKRCLGSNCGKRRTPADLVVDRPEDSRRLALYH